MPPARIPPREVLLSDAASSADFAPQSAAVPSHVTMTTAAQRAMSIQFPRIESEVLQSPPLDTAGFPHVPTRPACPPCRARGGRRSPSRQDVLQGRARRSFTAQEKLVQLAAHQAACTRNGGRAYLLAERLYWFQVIEWRRFRDAASCRARYRATPVMETRSTSPRVNDDSVRLLKWSLLAGEVRRTDQLVSPGGQEVRNSA